jgi:hypothetical protein
MPSIPITPRAEETPNIPKGRDDETKLIADIVELARK